MSSGGKIQCVPLLPGGPGSQRQLTLVSYGSESGRPKAYLQAALHADEIPGLLVLHHLRALLDAADQRGDILGHVVVNTMANPIGLGQHVNGKLLGRYALTGAGNFNRLYPEIADAVAARVAGRLSSDSESNVEIIRRAIGDSLSERSPLDDTDHLRLTLFKLAFDADIVLDLHCDEEALFHVYTGTPLWPSAADLSAQVGSRATLLATTSGGNPFDEATGGIWWQLAERFPDLPVPAACLSATLELRGETDVDDGIARGDAMNLFSFLQRRGLIAGDPGALPAPLCEATPLEGVDIIRAPVQGVVSYTRGLGERVEADEVVAVLVDPAAADVKQARTEVRARASGLLFTRRSTRFARPGDVLCKVAGPTPLAERIGGHLLSD